ncbi:hypothetical protein E4T47_02993 [Aureobasidium subglaciale]|nr:hypothetical protein E4T47_02993 [Aureobasidium subglaciale]
MSTPTQYSHFRDLFDSKTFSDVKLRFGSDNVDFNAHRTILMGASGVFFTAFTGRVPDGIYTIEGHSSEVFLAMLRYVYGILVDSILHDTELADRTSKTARVDFLFDLFLIANEYDVPLLSDFVTTTIVSLLHQLKPLRDEADNESFRAIISKTADFYTNSQIADQALVDAVVEVCADYEPGLCVFEEKIEISAILGRVDVFGGRLLQTSAKLSKLEAIYCGEPWSSSEEFKFIPRTHAHAQSPRRRR